MKERPHDTDIFKKFVNQLEVIDQLPPQKPLEAARRLEGEKCPDCGCKTLFKIEDCDKCEACGYMAC